MFIVSSLTRTHELPIVHFLQPRINSLYNVPFTGFWFVSVGDAFRAEPGSKVSPFATPKGKESLSESYYRRCCTGEAHMNLLGISTYQRQINIFLKLRQKEVTNSVEISSFYYGYKYKRIAMLQNHSTALYSILVKEEESILPEIYQTPARPRSPVAMTSSTQRSKSLPF